MSSIERRHERELAPARPPQPTMSQDGWIGTACIPSAIVQPRRATWSVQVPPACMCSRQSFSTSSSLSNRVRATPPRGRVGERDRQGPGSSYLQVLDTAGASSRSKRRTRSSRASGGMTRSRSRSRGSDASRRRDISAHANNWTGTLVRQMATASRAPQMVWTADHENIVVAAIEAEQAKPHRRPRLSLVPAATAASVHSSPAHAWPAAARQAVSLARTACIGMRRELADLKRSCQ